MKITKLQGLTVLSMLVVSAFTSCEEHNPFSEQELFNQEYSKNFFAKYGNFPANQSWDFSEQPRTCTTDPSVFDLGWNSGATTRAITPTSVTVTKLGDDNWYSVDKATQAWALEHLVEGRNNTLEGHPFSLVFPNEGTNKFAIIPIFKGQACITWQLCLSDGTNEKVLWEPWPLQPNVDENKDRDGFVKPNDYTSDIQYYFGSAWQNVHYKDNLENVSESDLRSRPIIVSGVTGEFYLYLKTTYIQDNKDWDDSEGHHDGHKYGNVGDIQSSIGGCMSALTCTAPANINSYKTMLGMDHDITNVMVIGCEDHQSGTVDWDMNDIVFLFVGLPELPNKREVTKSKRYLIEDLGTTVDFDFNDVVVDVTETSLININSGTEEIYTQEAIIKHLCGTVPFKVYFDKGSDGNYVNASFNGEEPIQGVVQSLYEECKDASGNYTYKLIYSQHGGGISGRTEKPFWKSAKDQDNIRIDVYESETLHGQNWSEEGSVGQIRTAWFDKPGATTAPYIIAVPTTQMWTKENVDFPIGSFNKHPQYQ